MVLLASTSAQADDDVVLLYDGHAMATSVVRAARFSGIPEDDFRPTTLPALLKDAAPRGTGSLVVTTCLGNPRTIADLRRDVAGLDAAIFARNEATAPALHATFLDDLACLAEPLDDPTLLATEWRLLGIAYGFMDRKEEEGAAFHQETLFPADVEWDTRYPSRYFLDVERERKSALDKAISVPLTPSRPRGDVSVDGRPAFFDGDALLLRVGLHLVQYGVEMRHSIIVDVKDAPGQRLEIPALTPDAWIASVADPSRETELGSLIGLALPEGATVYATTGDRVYVGHVTASDEGARTWKRLPDPTRTWRILAWSGAGLLVGGGGFATWQGIQARSWDSKVEDALIAADQDSWVTAQSRRDDARTFSYAGGGVALAGLALAGTGLVALNVHGISFGPAFYAGGLGLVVGR